MLDTSKTKPLARVVDDLHAGPCTKRPRFVRPKKFPRNERVRHEGNSKAKAGVSSIEKRREEITRPEVAGVFSGGAVERGA